MDDLTRLLLHARDGDRIALAAAIRVGQADVWRLCAHLVDRDEADDLTQDTLVRAIRALPAYRAEASGRTWLLAIARRACADALRSRQRRRRLTARFSLFLAVPSEALPAEDRSGAWVDQVVARLADERREAFVLTQLLGLSYEEAAAACDVPIGTIRSRVARARRDLVEWTRAGEDTG